MLDVKKAITAAKSALIDWFGLSIQRSLRLEEVEAPGEDHAWFITMSFIHPTRSPGRIAAKLQSEADRVFKSIQVDATTGNVRKMKIRVPE